MVKTSWNSAAEAVFVQGYRDAAAVRCRPDAELRHEAIAVAAVDRADELDDFSALRARDPLEQERRRVERHAHRLGLLLVRHRRLDGLLAPDDGDAVAAPKERV